MILDFRLKVFLVTARLGSFSRASRVLNITQPAVSQNIAELESDIGAELFVRGAGHPVALTDKGKSLLGYAERILSLYEQLNADLVPGGSRGGEVVELRIAAVKLAVQFVLPEAVKKFGKSYPSVTFSIMERTDEENASLLKEGIVDLGITAASLGEKSSLLAELLPAGSPRAIAGVWTTTSGKSAKDEIIRKFILNILTL
ncbi:MAG: LysR family transcriptional regulator [Alistipes sp.]|nr:LysR family transcriptional regulator [Candidatus Minthomonas equi]